MLVNKRTAMFDETTECLRSIWEHKQDFKYREYFDVVDTRSIPDMK